MRLSPAVWGASLVCALGGAFAGTALGSSPVITTHAAYADAPESNSRSFLNSDREQQALPNHYPLVTRSGTVAVEQLSDRGLYAQARYRPSLASVWDGEAAGMAEGPGPEPSVFAEPREPASLHEADGPAPRDAGEPAPSLALSQPVTVAANGNAKTIDVRATLALR